MAAAPMDQNYALRNEVVDLRRDMNEQFERVDQRFDQLRVLVEAVQSDVKLILEHLAPTITQVTDHERRITKLERRDR